MVEDANYPEGLFFDAKKGRGGSEPSSREVQQLADSIRVLENTVNELRKDILTIREAVSDKA